MAGTTGELERETAEHGQDGQDPGSVYEPQLVESQPVQVESYAESIARAQLLEAQAEAVRRETEAKLKIAQGKAAAQGRRDELALQRAEAKHRAELDKINAAAEREREALAEERAERARREEERARQEAERRQAAQEQAAKARSWRRAALGFAMVCALVSLPVQVDAFWSPRAPWLAVAPLVLEGGAWVVLRGADAAVAEHRPHWHYRLIAWLIAGIAAGINFSHGITHFDPATAFGTAFASLAGPGVWDLHEHGRIRVRDGRLTRRERRAKEAAEKAERAERERREAEERTAAEKAAKDAHDRAEKLAKERQQKYPEEWKRALMLAAALGEIEVTEEVWRRAWWDLHQADPGESVDVIRTRNVAALRMSRARAENPTAKPASGAQKAATSQVASQIPPAERKSGRRLAQPPRRRKGDAAPYHPAARLAARETAQRSARRSA
jgi:hypothetical protein